MNEQKKKRTIKKKSYIKWNVYKENLKVAGMWRKSDRKRYYEWLIVIFEIFKWIQIRRGIFE